MRHQAIGQSQLSETGMVEGMCEHHTDCPEHQICEFEHVCTLRSCGIEGGYFCPRGYTCRDTVCRRDDDKVACETYGGSWCPTYQTCVDICPGHLDSSCSCIECDLDQLWDPVREQCQDRCPEGFWYDIAEDRCKEGKLRRPEDLVDLVDRVRTGVMLAGAVMLVAGGIALWWVLR